MTDDKINVVFTKFDAVIKSQTGTVQQCVDLAAAAEEVKACLREVYNDAKNAVKCMGAAEGLTSNWKNRAEKAEAALLKYEPAPTAEAAPSNVTPIK